MLMPHHNYKVSGLVLVLAFMLQTAQVQAQGNNLVTNYQIPLVPLSNQSVNRISLVRYIGIQRVKPHIASYFHAVSFSANGQSTARVTYSEATPLGEFGSMQFGLTVAGATQGRCVLSPEDIQRPGPSATLPERPTSEFREVAAAYESQIMRTGAVQLAAAPGSPLLQFFRAIRGEIVMADSAARSRAAETPVTVRVVSADNSYASPVNQAVRNAVATLAGAARPGAVAMAGAARVQLAAAGSFIGRPAGAAGVEIARVPLGGEAYDALSTTDIRTVSAATGVGNIASIAWQPIIIGGAR